jgi:hypothetical protein
MTRNEILEVAGQFYTPETITEREIAFARHMMEYEREACAKRLEAVGCDHCAKNIRLRNKE